MITEEQITMAAEEIHGQLGGAVAFSRLTDTQRAELCDAARAVADVLCPWWRGDAHVVASGGYEAAAMECERLAEECSVRARESTADGTAAYWGGRACSYIAAASIIREHAQHVPVVDRAAVPGERVVSEPDAPVKLTAITLTPEQRAGLTTGGARIPGRNESPRPFAATGGRTEGALTLRDERSTAAAVPASEPAPADGAAFGFEPYTDAHTGELLFRRKSSEPAPAASVPDELPPRAPMQHELKTWPPFFGDVRSGMKSFDVRPADRDYRVCDTLRLREWDPANGDYSGEEHVATVTYVLTGGVFGVERGYVVLGLSAAMAAAPQVEPVLLLCPRCGVQHVDSGEWATRPHHTHQCQACGAEWRVPDYVRGVRMYNADALAAAPQRVREVSADDVMRAWDDASDPDGEGLSLGEMARVAAGLCVAVPDTERAALVAERDGLRADLEELGHAHTDAKGRLANAEASVCELEKRAGAAEAKCDALAAHLDEEQKRLRFKLSEYEASYGPWREEVLRNDEVRAIVQDHDSTRAGDSMAVATARVLVAMSRELARVRELEARPVVVDAGARKALLKLIGLLSERDPRAQEVACEMHAALKGGA